MREGRSTGAWLFFFFVVVILLWLILIPLGQMIVSSFRTGHPVAPGPFTFKNYLAAYFNPLTYRMIFNTTLFAAPARRSRFPSRCSSPG